MKFWSIFFALTVRSTVPLSLHPPRRTLRAVPARARICFQKKQRLVFLQKNRHFLKIRTNYSIFPCVMSFPLFLSKSIKSLPVKSNF